MRGPAWRSVTSPRSRRAEGPSGFFAARTNWNLESNRLSEALARHRAAGKPLIDLTASNPTQCGFHYDSEAILRALANPASLIYEPQAQGLAPVREAVAGYYAHRGERVAAEDILLTTGTSEAYSFVFRLLCDPGCEILVPSPSYPLFDFLADLQDVKLVRYPLQYDYGWQIDLGALEAAITSRTRAVVVVHPNNPTGNFCSPSEAAKLNELCSRHELALIADEVFLDFVLGDDLADASGPRSSAQARSFAWNERVLTFTLSGLSKICGLPQMKLAWLVTSGPAELKSRALARLDVIADTYLSMNAPVQHAASALFAQRSAFQRQLMDRVRQNLAELDRRLAAQKSCSRLALQGGWYAVIRVPRSRTDEELAIELLTTKNVYIHPGHFYDFADEGHLIASLIADAAQFGTGVAQVLSTFE
jgi:alanine-synthesizing transaminase